MAKANLFDALADSEASARAHQDSRVPLARKSADDVDCAPVAQSIHTDYATGVDDMLVQTHVGHIAPSALQDVSPKAVGSKRRVNISISADVHEAMKHAAEQYGTSVSALCLEGWLAIKGRYGK